MNDISKIGNVTNAVPTAKAEGPQHAKLKKATQDFEAVFLGQMLKQMRKSMSGGNALFGNSNEAKMFQEMADEATANQMSKTGGFGLAKTLYTSLARMLPNEDAPAAPAGSTAAITSTIGAPQPTRKTSAMTGAALAIAGTTQPPALNATAVTGASAKPAARFAAKESGAK